jgi:uncharacterized membrane protein SpoIIM required for sporulation
VSGALLPALLLAALIGLSLGTAILGFRALTRAGVL